MARSIASLADFDLDDLDPIPTRLMQRPNHPAPSDVERLRRRNEEWRRRHDEGVAGPDGRLVRESFDEIAERFNRTKRTVIRGVQQAREIHGALAHVESLDPSRSSR